MPAQPQVAGEPKKWQFTISREVVTRDEQLMFREDLAHLGLDDIAWTILNGSLATGTRGSIPKVLRGYQNGSLAGIAYFVECRRYGQSLFPQSRWAALLDAAPLPICIWLRNGALNDAISNPGFVVSGVARAEFIAQAVAHLRNAYLLGGILEASDDETVGVYATFPFCDNGIIDLRDQQQVDELYADSKNLRRKINKFRNKGGEIELCKGVLSPELCADAIRCMNSVKAVLTSPFQDNYNNMVLQASAHDSEQMLHFIARIEGECVGYHSFARAGNSLYCLSGAFDRMRHTNYHAYENLILTSIRFCLDQGLEAIHYGMVVNETKAKMMSHFVPVKQRYFARYSIIQYVAKMLMARTQLASTAITSYANLSQLHAPAS